MRRLGKDLGIVLNASRRHESNTHRPLLETEHKWAVDYGDPECAHV